MQDLALRSFQGMVIVRNDRVVFANPAFSRIIGMTETALVGLTSQQFMQYVHPEDQPWVARRYAERIDGKTLPAQYELRLVRPDGALRWVEILPTRIVQAGATVLQVLFLDVTERKAAQDALRESEANLRAMVDNANEAILITTADGRNVYCNPFAAKMTGFSQEELLHLSMADLFPPEEYDNICRITKQRLAGLAVVSPYESVLRARDGRVLSVEITGARTVWRGRPATLGMIRDITDRKLSEAALTSSHDLLVRVEQLANLGSFEYDFVTGSVNWSDHTYRIFGQDREHFVPTHERILTLIHPADRPQYEAITLASMQRAPNHDVELRIVWPDGTIRHTLSRMVIHFSQDQRPLRVIGFTMDVTDRHAAIKALRDSESRYRTLVEHAADTIFTVDLATHRLLDINPAGESLLGMKADELVGLSADSFVDPRETRTHPLHWKEAEEGQKVTDRRYITTRSGARIYVESLLCPLPDSRLLVIARDISERREVENEMLQAVTREQQRIGQALHDSVGQEIAGVAYMAQSMETQMSEAGTPGCDDMRKLSQNLIRALSQTRHFIRSLGPIPSVETRLPEALRELACNAEELYSIPCRCHIPLTTVVPDPDTSRQLYYIAREAVFNAMRHGKPTRVDIRLTSSRDPFLIIADNGCGMPAKNPVAATMGIRIMKHRAELIGGVLTIESAPGKGTRVRCVFANRAPKNRGGTGAARRTNRK